MPLPIAHDCDVGCAVDPPCAAWSQGRFRCRQQVKGLKRNLVVNTLGLVVAAVVTAPSVQDRVAALPTMAAAYAKYPSLQRLYVDGAYAGQCDYRMDAGHCLAVEVVRHPGNRNVGCCCSTQGNLFDTAPIEGFIPLPMRWVVKRTHVWNERVHRLIMHHDRNIPIAVAWVWLAEARLLSRRLTPG